LEGASQEGGTRKKSSQMMHKCKKRVPQSRVYFRAGVKIKGGKWGEGPKKELGSQTRNVSCLMPGRAKAEGGTVVKGRGESEANKAVQKNEGTVKKGGRKKKYVGKKKGGRRGEKKREGEEGSYN